MNCYSLPVKRVNACSDTSNQIYNRSSFRDETMTRNSLIFNLTSSSIARRRRQRGTKFNNIDGLGKKFANGNVGG